MPELNPSDDEGSQEKVIIRTTRHVDGESRKETMARMEAERRLEGELKTQTDRGAAIIASSLLDDALTQLLKSQLLINDKTVVLFNADRALGSLSSKLRMAYALSLIDSVVYEDVNYLRDIRNKFAHRVLIANNKGVEQPVGFQTPSIRDQCKLLKYPDRNPPFDDAAMEEKVRIDTWKDDPHFPRLPAPTDARERFIYTCTGLTILIQSHATWPPEKARQYPLGY